MAKRRSMTRPAVPHALQLIALPGLPEIRKGDVLSHVIAQAARQAKTSFQSGDVVVIAQKIVSKAEGNVVDLTQIKPSSRAIPLAAKLKKDPRLVEVILSESQRIVREDPVLISETRHGFVCANAGVDHSNVPGVDLVTLLPRDPDASARKIATGLRRVTGKGIAVIISDTFGRPW